MRVFVSFCALAVLLSLLAGCGTDLPEEHRPALADEAAIGRWQEGGGPADPALHLREDGSFEAFQWPGLAFGATGDFASARYNGTGTWQLRELAGHFSVVLHWQSVAKKPYEASHRADLLHEQDPSRLRFAAGERNTETILLTKTADEN